MKYLLALLSVFFFVNVKSQKVEFLTNKPYRTIGTSQRMSKELMATLQGRLQEEVAPVLRPTYDDEHLLEVLSKVPQIQPKGIYQTFDGDTFYKIDGDTVYKITRSFTFKKPVVVYVDSTVYYYYDSVIKAPVVVVSPPVVVPTRSNITFQSLGAEKDAISKWPVVGTSTSYGITQATIGGRAAIRFEVRKTDPIFAGGLRAELSRLSEVNTPVYEVTYGISYYIPTDWVNDQPTLFDIVHQFHDNTYGVAGETEYKSPFDFGIDATNWQFQVRSGAGNVEKKFVIGTVEKGKWVDFVIHIKFVRTGSAGLVEIWKDGVKTNTYNGAVGFDHYYAPYFKMGNYKWPWNPQDLACCGATNSKVHVLYISNVRLGTAKASSADVTPSN